MTKNMIELARIILHRVANKFLCPVFKWGTDEEWEFGLQRVINFPKTSLARKQNERTYLLKTLAGCPKDANKIERYIYKVYRFQLRINPIPHSAQLSRCLNAIFAKFSKTIFLVVPDKLKLALSWIT